MLLDKSNSDLDLSVGLNIENKEIDEYIASRKMTEEEIIAGCKKGKRKAQDELYKRYCASMLGVAMRYSANKSEAEDALQEAFIRIFRYIVNFEGKHEGSLSAWIKTIVVNTTLSHNRNNKKHHYTEDIEETNLGESDVYIENEEEVSNRKQNKILKAIQDLPSGYRNVFNLYIIEGYTHKEIAEILDISENTSKSQLSKARKYLQKKLDIEN